MTKFVFKSRIRYDGNVLRVTMPESMKHKRFEACVDNGKVIIAEATGENGIKVTWNGNRKYPLYSLAFGKKWVGEKLPKFSVSEDVTLEAGQMLLSLPEQDNKRLSHVVSKNDKRPYTRRSETVSAALNLINKYAHENGYEFEIKDNKMTLVKYDRIG
jgi:hypothetical protein